MHVEIHADALPTMNPPLNPNPHSHALNTTMMIAADLDQMQQLDWDKTIHFIDVVNTISTSPSHSQAAYGMATSLSEAVSQSKFVSIYREII